MLENFSKIKLVKMNNMLMDALLLFVVLVLCTVNADLLNRMYFPPEKTKDTTLLAPKALQPGLYPSPGGPTPLPVPSLVPTPGERLGPGALLLQRQGEEERWLARQRRLRADTADRQGLMSECSQHNTEPEIQEPQTDSQR